jgi:hypothetical protein
MTISRYMERRAPDARAHTFPCSLRDWLAECTEAAHDVAESVLGHVRGSAVVKACRRTAFLEQRRVLAELWADPVAVGVAAKLSGGGA